MATEVDRARRDSTPAGTASPESKLTVAVNAESHRIYGEEGRKLNHAQTAQFMKSNPVAIKLGVLIGERIGLYYDLEDRHRSQTQIFEYSLTRSALEGDGFFALGLGFGIGKAFVCNTQPEKALLDLIEELRSKSAYFDIGFRYGNSLPAGANEYQERHTLLDAERIAIAMLLAERGSTIRE